MPQRTERVIKETDTYIIKEVTRTFPPLPDSDSDKPRVIVTRRKTMKFDASNPPFPRSALNFEPRKATAYRGGLEDDTEEWSDTQGFM